MKNDFMVSVHALVYLYHKKGEYVSSEELAGNICTTSSKVRKVLSLLQKNGFITSRLGLVGGYILAKEDITLAEVADAIGAEFVSTNYKTGDIDMDCLVSSNMGQIMDGILNEMNEMCTDYLKKYSIKSINGVIFKRKENGKV